MSMLLSETGEFLTKNNEIAKTFNSFLEIVTDSFYLVGLLELMY